MADHLTPDFYRSVGADSRDNRDTRGRFQARQAEADRFWSHVDMSHPAGCWPWTSDTTDSGYGRFYLAGGSEIRAHRYAYELVVGPIPDGLTLDHLEQCLNPRCVRPAHLEPVSNSENLRRRHARHRARQETAS